MWPITRPGAGWDRDKACYLEGTSPHPPRENRTCDSSPHTAQGSQIGLSFNSVTVVAEYLVVIQVVCLQWVFELCAKYDMVSEYFACMECTLAHCAYRAISQEYCFPDIHMSLPPSFISGPECLIGEYEFSSDAPFDRVGVIPASYHQPFCLKLMGHY